MSVELTFTPAFVSSDGGEDVFELRTTVGEIASLHRAGYLEVGNIRPDHAKITTARGERFKRTSDRQKRWTDQLSRGRGVLGNLSWNADPEKNEVDWDEEAGVLVVRGKGGRHPRLETPDSATRHRAILDAVTAPMPTVDEDRPVSVRLWLVPRRASDPEILTAPAVFDSYNQDGKPVNATVAKHAYQRDSLEQLVHALVYASPHLGLDNVETIQNTVSRESSKLMAYNTIYTAFRDGYGQDVEDADLRDAELEWLTHYWDKLVESIPELGRVTLSKRKEYRRESIAGSATMIHAYVRLADHLRDEGADADHVSSLRDLKATLVTDGLRTVVPPGSTEPEPLHRAGETVGYFSPDNPLWAAIGVVVAKTRDDGSTAAEVRNAFQTRTAAAKALITAIAPATTKTKQDAVNELCDMIGINRLSVGVGSSLPAALFEALAEFAGVETGPMPVVGKRVAEAAGLTWTSFCDSRHTPSRGGSTVTLEGLRVLIDAVHQLRS
jgi:hypothetical protein